MKEDNMEKRHSLLHFMRWRDNNLDGLRGLYEDFQNESDDEGKTAFHDFCEFMYVGRNHPCGRALDLEREDKMTRTVRFSVTGRGKFPWDMLRYASAWPATSVDAYFINLNRDRREIFLETDRGGPRSYPLTDGVVKRFASFGWRVGHCDGKEYDPQGGWYDPADAD